MPLFTTWFHRKWSELSSKLPIKDNSPLTLNSSCWDNVDRVSSAPATAFLSSADSDFVGITRAIEAFCCDCAGCRSSCSPTGIGGSSRIVGWGIIDDGEGLITIHSHGCTSSIVIKRTLLCGGGIGTDGDVGRLDAEGTAKLRIEIHWFLIVSKERNLLRTSSGWVNNRRLRNRSWYSCSWIEHGRKH